MQMVIIVTTVFVCDCCDVSSCKEGFSAWSELNVQMDHVYEAKTRDLTFRL